MTIKLPVDVLLCASVAEQLTVVAPSGKVEPEVGTQLTKTEPSTMSLAEAENVTTAPEGPVALVVMLAGRLSTGAVVSTIWTVKVVGVATLLFESMALQVTVVLPTTKVVPEAGVQVAIPAPSTISDVDGLE